MGMRVSGQGERVMAALAAERPFRRAGDGWTAGPLRAPGALVDELKRGGLVEERAGALGLTAAGRARGRGRPVRLLAERPARDAPADGADGSARGPGRAAAGPAARAGGGGAPSAARSVTVNLLESPLGWLRARGLVDERRFQAGERLRADWTMAGLGPRVTMRWDAAPAGRGPRGPDAPLDPTLAGIAARRRFDGALDAAGRDLRDILWRVVCAGEGLAAAEGALGWPRRAGKLVLLMALDRVADYYGLA